MFLRRKRVNSYIRKGYDLNLISRTQPPRLNFQEDDSYIKTGHGYVSVSYIPNNGYPETLPNYWGSQLVQIQDATVFRPIIHASNEDITQETQDAISNLSNSSNRYETSDLEDSGDIGKLLELKAAAANNIVTKKVGTSFYISADTPELLKQKEKEIRSKLTSYKLFPSHGMLDVEYDMVFIPPSIHSSLPTRRKYQPIPVTTLGAGYPFVHTTLMDKHGVFLGSTRTGGAVYFDLLHRDSERLAPTMMIAGQNNVGKGKLLVKQLDALFAKGHTMINIDLSGILKDLTNKQGGLHIDIVDGESEYHINPLHVMATRILDGTLNTNHIRSYKVHRNKLKVLACMKDSSLKETDLSNLTKTVDKLYKDFGLWELSEAEQKNDILHITDVVNEDYPLLGNLVDALDADWRNAQSKGDAGKAKADSYEKLVSAFQSILDDYRFLNNHSRFFDLDDEKVVTFDLSSIDDKTLLHIQLYQILSMAASLSVKNGIKNRMDEDIDEDEVVNHCIITITGADKLFDPTHAQSLTFLSEMIEEISKTDSAFILEISSLDKILSSAKLDDVSPYILATRSVFSQIRYRIFSQLDVMVIPKLAEALRGEMTPSELESLRYLQYGQFFLNIANVNNYSFEMQLSANEDIAYYNVPYAESARYHKLR